MKIKVLRRINQKVRKKKKIVMKISFFVIIIIALIQNIGEIMKIAVLIRKRKIKAYLKNIVIVIKIIIIIKIII